MHAHYVTLRICKYKFKIFAPPFVTLSRGYYRQFKGSFQFGFMIVYSTTSIRPISYSSIILDSFISYIYYSQNYSSIMYTCLVLASIKLVVKVRRIRPINFSNN